MNIESILGMALLAAAHKAVIAARILNEPAPPGYWYLWGAIVWNAKEPDWLPGLWEASP